MPSNSRLRRPTPKWAQEADELAERYRPRASLYPESIRRLAVAMVEHALADLERPRWIRGAGRYVPADYRPDPDGAVAWIHRGGDAPLSARWCEQITGVCLDPLRRKYPQRTEGSISHGNRLESAETRGGPSPSSPPRPRREKRRLARGNPPTRFEGALARDPAPVSAAVATAHTRRGDAAAGDQGAVPRVLRVRSGRRARLQRPGVPIVDQAASISTRRGRPETPARPNEAALRAYGFSGGR